VSWSVDRPPPRSRLTQQDVYALLHKDARREHYRDAVVEAADELCRALHPTIAAASSSSPLLPAWRKLVAALADDVYC
jgi:hypothetical protein